MTDRLRTGGGGGSGASVATLMPRQTERVGLIWRAVPTPSRRAAADARMQGRAGRCLR